MAVAIFAGLVAQFPLSWLSDRYNRTRLMQLNALVLIVAALPLALLPKTGFHLLLAFGFIVSMLQFSLYPLAVALANDLIEPERRVSLAACLLMSFGVGASIGPLLVGMLIEPLGGNTLYAFFALCGLLIAVLSRTAKQDEKNLAQDAPVPHIPMPDSLMSSPLSPALNPAFDEQMIEEVMPSIESESATEVEAEAESDAASHQGADPDEETGLKKAWEKL